MVIACTGHRPDKLGKEWDMRGPISNWISERMEEVLNDLRPEKCISGMALGVDMIYAITAISLNIPIIAAIPFKGQELAWPEQSQALYNKILPHKLVTKHYVSEPGYSAYKMQVRNQWMTDHCDTLIAVWDGSEGGTANCVKYARKISREIIRINPKDFYEK